MTRREPDRTQDLLRAALSLAARGWHVFPCVPGRKHPALRVNWQEIATTDPERITAWWRRTAYNIAIACGPSNLVVLDLDVAGHGAGPVAGDALNGADTLARLCAEQGDPYPDGTTTVHTPSGGIHFYFQAPKEAVPNSAGRLVPLVDVRGAGGYVIACGSRTPQGLYRASGPASPSPLPAWIAELARQPVASPVPAATPSLIRDGSAYADAVLGYEADRVARAAVGSRNDTLFRAARSLGQLAAGGAISPDAVRAALTQAAETAGLGRAETTRTIESGLKSGTRMPRARPSSAPTPDAHEERLAAPHRQPSRWSLQKYRPVRYPVVALRL
jgi:hypothetical protein